MGTELRDAVCAENIGKMAAMGKFQHEFDMYGCAWLTKQEVQYCIGQNPEQIYGLVQNGYKEGIYATPVMHYAYRTLVPSGMKEQFEKQAAQSLAQQMKQQLREEVLYALQPFAEQQPNNTAYMLLEQYRKEIEWSFSEQKLQLLEGAVDRASRGKVLDGWHEQKIRFWIDDVRQQMVDNPVLEKPFQRKFYGFRYRDASGKMVSVIDAQMYRVQEKQLQLELQGMRVTPIYQHLYSMDSFQELAGIRRLFQQELEIQQDNAYINFVTELQRQTGVINRTKLLDILNTTDKLFTRQTVQHYVSIWNACY